MIPTVDGVTALGVTAHEATLEGVVSAGAAPADFWVEFGPTKAYGQSTTPARLGAGSSPRPVAVALSSLSPAVNYHARLVVSSAVGSVASSDVAFSTLPDARATRVAAAGDIACAPTDPSFNGGVGTAAACQQMATSSAILAGGYDAVLPLGDTQYNAGTTPAFKASYRPSWGRVDAIAHPVVGNHEYGTPGAAQYFQYFGASAGTPGQGWYSYELGSWHVIALNANCTLIAGGCGTGSPEEIWLRSDLAAHPVQCTLAYWHQPLFTSGQQGPAVAMSTIWADLTSAGADLVLNGHEHDYERFAPQTASGRLDTAHGMAEIIVGTGGANHMSLHATRMPNSVTSDSTSFGFLDLTLSPGTYSWSFVPVAGGAFHDTGSAACH
jgi:acid phosphatase type 7